MIRNFIVAPALAASVLASPLPSTPVDAASVPTFKRANVELVGWRQGWRQRDWGGPNYSVGYDGYGGRPGYYADDSYNYYSDDWQSPPNAEYDYDNSYDYPNSYYSSDYDNYSYDRWPSYTSVPDRYYGTRAPVEAYERDDYYVWLPPSKPRSCGEHHYWTGFSCVDARHFKPYVGPKW